MLLALATEPLNADPATAMEESHMALVIHISRKISNVRHEQITRFGQAGSPK